MAPPDLAWLSVAGEWTGPQPAVEPDRKDLDPAALELFDAAERAYRAQSGSRQGIRLRSGYRTVERQFWLWANWRKSKWAASSELVIRRMFLAVNLGPAPPANLPGTSMHNLGFAVDVDNGGKSGPPADLVDVLAEFGWRRSAWKFFHATGTWAEADTSVGEPWHFECTGLGATGKAWPATVRRYRRAQRTCQAIRPLAVEMAGLWNAAQALWDRRSRVAETARKIEEGLREGAADVKAAYFHLQAVEALGPLASTIEAEMRRFERLAQGVNDAARAFSQPGAGWTEDDSEVRAWRVEYDRAMRMRASLVTQVSAYGKAVEDVTRREEEIRSEIRAVRADCERRRGQFSRDFKREMDEIADQLRPLQAEIQRLVQDLTERTEAFRRESQGRR
jgi:hypothetical protein